MKCPYCAVAFHEQFEISRLLADKNGGWELHYTKCPECSQLIAILKNGTPISGDLGAFDGIRSVEDQTTVWPKSAAVEPCPDEVPKHIREDYEEAGNVLQFSAKASAALSRRALQSLLRDAASVQRPTLAEEIEDVLKSGSLPSNLADEIDAIRNIGNFAAHPLKSQHTGQILPVEKGEAEWNLEVLRDLFDFYYVQPAVRAKRKAALNKKLQEAGKHPMK